jgi:aromatic ring hydroxylase
LVAAGVARHEVQLGNVIEDRDSDFARQHSVLPSVDQQDGPFDASEVMCAIADAKTRIKLLRLAFDAAVSSFSGRQQLYERYYSGDPVGLAGTLYGLYDKDTYIERISSLLDDLEAQQIAGWPVPRSHPLG